MKEIERNISGPAPEPTAAVAGDVSPQDSVARRRAVLKRLSAGVTLAAAGVARPALATGGSSGRKHCFHKDTPHKKVKACVSGMHSVISSAMASDYPECPGHSCTHYTDRDCWPSDSTGKYCKGWNGVKFRRGQAFKDVFNCSGGGYRDLPLRDLMNVDCAERHWLTACLNATKFEFSGPSGTFCYTPHEVVELYHDPSKCLDAYVLFKDHLEHYG